jgi:hypothetical protein
MNILLYVSTISKDAKMNDVIEKIVRKASHLNLILTGPVERIPVTGIRPKHCIKHRTDDEKQNYVYESFIINTSYLVQLQCEKIDCHLFLKLLKEFKKKAI